MMYFLPVALAALATFAPVRAVPVDNDGSNMGSSTMASAVATSTMASSAASSTMAGPSSTASGAAPSSTSAGGNQSTDFVATTWYASWHAEYLSPEDFPWSKYTAVGYSFALTDPDPTNVTISDPANFQPFLDAAHKNGVAAHLTIGGWTGSRYFSTAVGSAENRTAFVKTMTDLVQQYNLDGLDFDWEYPNHPGLECNINNSGDSANFLLFLQELRKALPNTTLSAAASIHPFYGPSDTPDTSQPLEDVSAFAEVLDYVAIMAYDMFGPGWSTTVGPNAPLDDACVTGGAGASARSAVNEWIKAKFPANKLVLGVAAYGHSWSVDASAAFNTTGALPQNQPRDTKLLASYPAFNKQVPLGDMWDEDAAPSQDLCGTITSGPSGVWNYGNMVKQGILNADGTAAAGLGYLWDECSKTPFLYLPQNNSMIAYDDLQSFAAKGQFIQEMGLRGFAMWEAAGDHGTDLVDAITNAIHDQSSC